MKEEDRQVAPSALRRPVIVPQRLRLILRLPIVVLLMGLILFGSAGRLDLPFFWAYIIIWSSILFVGLMYVDIDLMKERWRPGPGAKDAKFRFLIGPPILMHLIVAGLDAGRYHWSSGFPASVQIAGLITIAAGMSLSIWAMVANRYFSSVIRIQEDRGHQVVTIGPYALIRHPGYAGMILGMVGSGFALGSWPSAVIAIVCIPLLINRTAFEDQYLRDNLPGYRDYATLTPYRLFPHIW